MTNINVIVFTLYYYNTFSSLVHSTATSSIGKCDVDIRHRTPCGWSTISSSQCKAKKCCWDSMAKDAVRCFKSKKWSIVKEHFAYFGTSSGMLVYKSMKIQDKAKKTCDVLISDRVPCRSSSSSKSECEQNGCCFDPLGFASSPCYETGFFRVNLEVEQELQCIRHCSGLSWKAVRVRYVRCMSSYACWMLFGGRNNGQCLAKCKKSIGKKMEDKTIAPRSTTVTATRLPSPRYASLSHNFIGKIFGFPHNFQQETEEE